MKFEELNISSTIKKTIEKHGFEETTEIQSKCIPEILSGKDVIGKSQTGSGKTFAYGIPAIQMIDPDLKKVQTIVICPTRELASQVCDEITKITGSSDTINVIPIFGGTNMNRQIKALKKDKPKIVVGTPGRLLDHIKRKTLKLDEIKMAVLDEADEMLDMGFIGDIQSILDVCKNKHQTVMFSATMPKQILNLTKNFMNNPEFIEIGSRLQLVSTIEQNFVYHEKNDAVIKLLNKFNPQMCIIFCDTKRMVDDLTDLLNENNIPTVCLHGDMSQNDRRKTLACFKAGDVKVLVGTDVAARGLDIKNVGLIINYDLPYDVEYYIHRIGRTGRAGCNGRAISLIVSNSQRKQLAYIEKEIKQKIPQILF